MNNSLSNTLIDNSTEELSMTATLKECLADERVKNVCIATGYWDVPGLALLEESLRTFLEREGTGLKLLIGKDPFVYANQVTSPKYKDASYPQDFIRTDIEELDVRDEYKRAVRLLLDFCTENDEDSKIEIRVFRRNENDETQFLHSKCYIFNGKQNGMGIGIVGSSNFTQKGLQGNAELNYVETSTIQVVSEDSSIARQKSHQLWFDEKWELSEPWNKQFLEQVLKPAPITKEVKKEKEKEEEPTTTEVLTPQETYVRYLHEYFGDVTDTTAKEVLRSYLPEGYTAYDYQTDAVLQCFAVMKRYGGFMLGDVVGLGKTVVGCLVIKKFLAEANTLGRTPRVLIVAPPAILRGWRETVETFDAGAGGTNMTSCVTFLSSGKLNSGGEEVREEEIEEEDAEADETDEENDITSSLNPNERYGLIVVDESHNFRNKNTQKYEALDDLISRCTLEDGVQPYVGLLSATFFNNRPADLYNQIALFQRSENASNIDGIPQGKIKQFFSNKNGEYESVMKNKDLNDDERKERINAISESIRQCVLNEVLVRRTRTDIVKYYTVDGKTLKFPTVRGPRELKYTMDERLNRLFIHTIEVINIDDKETDDEGKPMLGYYRYAAIQFLRDEENRELYETGSLTVENITNQLKRMMKILFVKRLESSQDAFRESVKTLRDTTQDMINLYDDDSVFVCPDIDIPSVFKKIRRDHAGYNSDEEIDAAKTRIRELIKKKGGNNKEFRRVDFESIFIDKLRSDVTILNRLLGDWEKMKDYDPKTDAFRRVVKEELMDPERNPERKLVIFTEAIATQHLIKKVLDEEGIRTLSVSADNRKEIEDTIRKNFDANYRGKREDKYRVIVSTDVLAEGVNLHRANEVLNYDTPWNAARLMQRIGRINRIGSQAEEIYVYNFMPSVQGDSQINLYRNAYTKLQSFHSLLGEDSKIYTEKESLSENHLQTMVNDEESPMAPYIADLLAYSTEHRKRFDEICAMPFRDLGGTIAKGEGDEAYVVLTIGNGGQRVVRIGAEGKAEQSCPLDFMRAVQCGPEAVYTTPSAQMSQAADIAKRFVEQTFAASTRARVAPKDQKKAREIVKELKERDGLSTQSKMLLNSASKAIKDGNKEIIRAALNIDESSLFGVNAEIEQVIASAFENVSRAVAKKTGGIETGTVMVLMKE